jgi:hypothetical protein
MAVLVSDTTFMTKLLESCGAEPTGPGPAGVVGSLHAVSASTAPAMVRRRIG